MCKALDPLGIFGGGGSSGGQAASTSTSTAGQSVTVNNSTSIDTRDIANALATMAAANSVTSAQAAHLQLAGAVAQAAATVQAAQITNSGQSFYLVAGAIVGVLGLLLTAGIIKVPRSWKA